MAAANIHVLQIMVNSNVIEEIGPIFNLIEV